MESYLMEKLDFYGSSLKFRARSNVLPLDGRLRSWVIGNDDTQCPRKNPRAGKELYNPRVGSSVKIVRGS